METDSTVSTNVGPLADLPSGTSRRIEVGGIAIALVRIDDSAYAIGDVCSHADVSLAGGEVWCDEKEIECPKHASAFSLETGVPTTLPATQPVQVFVAEIIDGDIVITVPSATDGASS
jgi:3-phenylpropionate/trans-cinnamate dioxygenase ferredoxin subunit